MLGSSWGEQKGDGPHGEELFKSLADKHISPNSSNNPPEGWQAHDCFFFSLLSKIQLAFITNLSVLGAFPSLRSREDLHVLICRSFPEGQDVCLRGFVISAVTMPDQCATKGFLDRKDDTPFAFVTCVDSGGGRWPNLGRFWHKLF